MDDYLVGCEVFLDCGGTGHKSGDDGTKTVRAAVTNGAGQVQFVFPQGEAQYTTELETCKFTFDAAPILGQPQGVPVSVRMCV